VTWHNDNVGFRKNEKKTGCRRLQTCAEVQFQPWTKGNWPQEEEEQEMEHEHEEAQVEESQHRAVFFELEAWRVRVLPQD
jgi:hypothetical protein